MVLAGGRAQRGGMLSVCNTGQKVHPLPFRCDGLERLRSRAAAPKRGTNLSAEPPARCFQERVEISAFKTGGRFGDIYRILTERAHLQLATPCTSIADRSLSLPWDGM